MHTAYVIYSSVLIALFAFLMLTAAWCAVGLVNVILGDLTMHTAYAVYCSALIALFAFELVRS